jgi:hypothetical protein
MKQVLKSIVSNTLGALRAKTAAVQPLQQLSPPSCAPWWVAPVPRRTDSPRGGW